MVEIVDNSTKKSVVVEIVDSSTKKSTLDKYIDDVVRLLHRSDPKVKKVFKFSKILVGLHKMSFLNINNLAMDGRGKNTGFYCVSMTPFICNPTFMTFTQVICYSLHSHVEASGVRLGARTTHQLIAFYYHFSVRFF
jgi:hypothetical protein